MYTYTTYRNQFGTLSQNNSSTNLSLGDSLINTALRYLTGKFYFNERSYTITTTAQQQFYNAPPQFKNALDVTVNIGNILWIPQFAPNRTFWDQLNTVTFYQDFPSFFYLYNGQIGIFPIPATTGNTITINYKVRITDLSQADYTTGTVSATVNSPTITSSGAAFVAGMADRWIQLSATSGGDNKWYQIQSVNTGTNTLTLYNNYTGPTIAGASYTIGEVPILAEDYQDLALYRALWIYHNSIVPDANKAKFYKVLYDEGYAMLNAEYGEKTTNVALTDEDIPIYNPNLFPRTLS